MTVTQIFIYHIWIWLLVFVWLYQFAIIYKFSIWSPTTLLANENRPKEGKQPNRLGGNCWSIYSYKFKLLQRFISYRMGSNQVQHTRNAHTTMLTDAKWLIVAHSNDYNFMAIMIFLFTFPIFCFLFLSITIYYITFLFVRVIVEHSIFS